MTIARRRTEGLAALLRGYGVSIAYAFGSRAKEVQRWLDGDEHALGPSASDIDIGIVPDEGLTLSLHDTVQLEYELELLFGAAPVDLLRFSEAGAFLAANMVSGERIYAVSEHGADEFDLYVLRRAGDLEYHERERYRQIVGADE